MRHAFGLPGGGVFEGGQALVVVAGEGGVHSVGGFPAVEFAGIVLRLSSMTASGTVPMSRLVPLGSHLCMSALFCSLVARWQGEWGSQKNTSTPVSDSMRCQRAISLPLSQVRVLAICCGTLPIAAVTAAVASAVYPPGSGGQ